MSLKSKAGFFNPKQGKGVKTSKKNIIIISIFGALTAGFLCFSFWFAFLR